MELKIISGGQTGVDQGALDAAIQLGIPHGGWCPKGRRSEAGPIPEKYQLEESTSSHYGDRTRMNIRDSDGTLIVVEAGKKIGPGTKLTIEMGKQFRKPVLVYFIGRVEQEPSQIEGWIKARGISVLNIAGSRESGNPGIQEKTRALLVEALRFAKEKED